MFRSIEQRLEDRSWNNWGKNSLLGDRVVDGTRGREGGDDAHQPVCEVPDVEVDGAASEEACAFELPAFEPRGVVEGSHCGYIECFGLREYGGSERDV